MTIKQEFKSCHYCGYREEDLIHNYHATQYMNQWYCSVRCLQEHSGADKDTEPYRDNNNYET